MGFLDHISDLCDCSRGDSKKLKKRKQLQRVKIKVKMDCEGCQRNVRKSVEGMKGVTQVEVEPKQHKVTVIGYVEPNEVLTCVKHGTGKRADFWPYIPCDVVQHPYAPGTYNKKAPGGYVRDAAENPEASSLARDSSVEHKVTVIGYVEPNEVLTCVKHGTGKRADFWPYVPCDVVQHPYAPGTYNKKAPGGYVRDAAENPEASSLARDSSVEVRYTTCFSDDNPNACMVM